MSASRKNGKIDRLNPTDENGCKVRQICPAMAITSPSWKEVSRCSSWRLATGMKAAKYYHAIFTRRFPRLVLPR
jgi:hypothetical protein